MHSFSLTAWAFPEFHPNCRVQWFAQFRNKTPRLWWVFTSKTPARFLGPWGPLTVLLGYNPPKIHSSSFSASSFSPPTKTYCFILQNKLPRFAIPKQLWPNKRDLFPFITITPLLCRSAAIPAPNHYYKINVTRGTWCNSRWTNKQENYITYTLGRLFGLKWNEYTYKSSSIH